MEQFVTQTQFNDFASKVYLRFDQMDEKMDRHYSQLRSQIDHLGTKVDGLESRIDGLESRIDRLESRIDRLENKVDRIENKVDRIENKLDDFIVELREANARTDARIARLEDERRSIH